MGEPYLLVCSREDAMESMYRKVANETGHYYRMSFMGPTLKMPIVVPVLINDKKVSTDKELHGCQFFWYANLTKLVKDQIDRSGMLPNEACKLFNGKRKDTILLQRKGEKCKIL
jgi:hypothetical protein